MPGNDRFALNLVVFDRRVGRGDERFRFLVGPQPNDFVHQLALGHLAIGRDQEAVFIDRGVHRQAGNQADVRAFRRFDRANAAVVGNVHVAHLEAGPLAVEAARAQAADSRRSCVSMRERVRLVDDLRQLAAAEEVLDRRRNALRIDQAARRHVLNVLEAHPLLHGAAELQEALPHFVGRQLVDRAQAAVAQVIDVVDVRVRLADCELQDVLDRADQVRRPQHHFVFRHGETQLAVDAEAADAAQAIAVRVVKLFVEQGPGLFQLRRIARPQPLINPQQRFFVARSCRRRPAR